MPAAWPFSGEPRKWDFDPDLGAVPLVDTALIGVTATIYLMGCVFTNTSGAARTITVTDESGKAVLYQVDIPDTGVPFSLDWSMLRLTGLHWVASGAGVNGKLWGWK